MADFELNSTSIAVVLSDLGAQLKSVRAPNRDGLMAEITRGGVRYAGATCGRFANRIAGGRFQIDGVGYQLSQNEGENQLHGGAVGFDAKEWSGSAYTSDDREGVAFTSPG